MDRNLATSIATHIDARLARLRDPEQFGSSRKDGRVDELAVAVQDLLHLILEIATALPERS